MAAECEVWDVDPRVLANLRELEKPTCSIPKECKWFKDRMLYMMTTQSGEKRIPVWVFADGFEFNGTRYSTVKEVLAATGVGEMQFVFHMGYMSN